MDVDTAELSPGSGEQLMAISEQAVIASALFCGFMLLRLLARTEFLLVAPLSRLVIDCAHYTVIALSLLGAGLAIVPILLLLRPLRSAVPAVWYPVCNGVFSSLWAVCIIALELCGGLTLRFQGDEPLPGEKLLVLSNHVSYLDWIAVLGLAARVEALGGVRFVAKASLRRIPLLGFALRLQQTIFIRSRPEGRVAGTSEEARARTVALDTADIAVTSRQLLEHSPSCWLCIFPEGTRVTPEQHQKALAFARSRGLQPHEYLLQPRPKGLEALLEGAQPRLTHALDVTLAYDGYSASTSKNASGAPSIVDGISRGVGVSVLVRRIELPEASERTESWLRGLWADKERALARWENDGRFEAEKVDLPLPLRPLVGGLLAYSVASIALTAVVTAAIHRFILYS